MNSLKPGKMVYKYLGNSGLQTSVIALGNMINFREENYEVDEQIIKTALAHGINHFDTAQKYAAGKAEIQLGKILKNLGVPREQVVIATKIRVAPEPDINSDNIINRKHIKESLNGSLKRLQMDYVDIIYAHFFDDLTPLQEICRGFHEVIQAGKAFYWATSNWDAEAVIDAIDICQRLNLHKPIGAQNQYNMLYRAENEVQNLSIFKNFKYGLVGWSPLAGGFLTGKYFEQMTEDQVNRFNDKHSPFPLDMMKELYYDSNSTEKNLRSLKELSDIAKNELGCKLTHLALAWAIKYQYLSCALVGARTAAQLQDTLKALEIVEKWTPVLEVKVNKILGNTPEPRLNAKIWKPYPPVRPEAL